MRNKNKDYKKVSVGGWIGTLLLSAIPGINLILWIIWAFSAKRPYISNLFRRESSENSLEC